MKYQPGPALRRLMLVALASCIGVFSSGCSTTPKPVAQLAGATTALMSAENQDATDFAPVAMDRARDKLRRAEEAVKKEEYGDAKRLAEEAQADAELAQAITGKTQAQVAVREMEISIEVLREEIMRGQEN